MSTIEKELRLEEKARLSMKKKELKELKKQVQAETRAIKATLKTGPDSMLSARQMENEIRREKRNAEKEYDRSMRELQTIVSNEAKLAKASGI